MTFRTPEESVQLANNTQYGLAASVWTESINLALDIAPKAQERRSGINSTNLFDASAGSAAIARAVLVVKAPGRHVGVRKALSASAHRSRPTARSTGSRKKVMSASPKAGSREPRAVCLPSIAPPSSSSVGSRRAPIRATRVASWDPTARRWARSPRGIARISEMPSRQRTARGSRGGRRRDICAVRSCITSRRTSPRAPRSSRRDCPPWTDAQRESTREVDASIRRLFTYAAWADKWDGAVDHVPSGRGVAMNETIGVMGVAAPEEFPPLGSSPRWRRRSPGQYGRGNPVGGVSLAATDFYASSRRRTCPRA